MSFLFDSNHELNFCTQWNHQTYLPVHVSITPSIQKPHDSTVSHPGTPQSPDVKFELSPAWMNSDVSSCNKIKTKKGFNLERITFSSGFFLSQNPFWKCKSLTFSIKWIMIQTLIWLDRYIWIIGLYQTYLLGFWLPTYLLQYKNIWEFPHVEVNAWWYILLQCTLPPAVRQIG